MGIEFKGASPEDQGPAGVVARLMLATSTGDSEAGMSLLAESCREGTELHEQPFDQAVVTIGEVTVEEGLHIVPTHTVDGETTDDTEFVVVEEAGEFRIDLDKTMERAMGFDPSEMMEQMGEAMAEGMGQMMEGMADAMGEAFGAVGDAMSEAMGGAAGAIEEAEAEDTPMPPCRVWTLAEDEIPPEEILNAAVAMSEHLTPPLTPEPVELHAQKWESGESRGTSTHYGNPDEGWILAQTETRDDDQASLSLVVTAYGLPLDHEFSVQWMKTQVPDGEPQVFVRVLYRAPPDALESLSGAMDANCEVLNVEDM